MTSAGYLSNPAAMLSSSVLRLVTLSYAGNRGELPRGTGSATGDTAKPRPFPDAAAHRSHGGACVANGYRCGSHSEAHSTSLGRHEQHARRFPSSVPVMARDRVKDVCTYGRLHANY
jgi:hypothetical protein